MEVRGIWKRATLTVALGAVALVGCASPLGGETARLEAEKAQLLSALRDQREELETLRARTASIERRLAESETELARLDPSRRERGLELEVADQSLPWRAPSEVSGEKGKSATRR